MCNKINKVVNNIMSDKKSKDYSSISDLNKMYKSTGKNIHVHAGKQVGSVNPTFIKKSKY
jgi:hypothetical protein